MDWEQLWHGWFRRPYRLEKRFDSGGGQPVVLLHGLGMRASVWRPLMDELDGQPYRTVAFDLLGFGESPKPERLDYDIDDHASAVIASIDRLHLGGHPAIVVGHSLGALISVRVATRRPDLVKHLILYEMPLYAGLPGARRYRLRMNLYLSLYRRLLKVDFGFVPGDRTRSQAVVEKLFGIRPRKDTWIAYVKSLQNSIMTQHAAEEISRMRVPIDVVFGKRDRLVIRGKTKALFGRDVAHVQAHTINERHRISETAAEFLAARIRAADGRQQPAARRPAQAHTLARSPSPGY
jgi:pimeloyl-ACP methyl ester carboxylesterase